MKILHDDLIHFCNYRIKKLEELCTEYSDNEKVSLINLQQETRFFAWTKRMDYKIAAESEGMNYRVAKVDLEKYKRLRVIAEYEQYSSAEEAHFMMRLQHLKKILPTTF
jgi:hypothetical protein